MAFIAAKGITQLGIDDSKLQRGIGRVGASLRGLQGRMKSVSRASRNFLLLGAAAVGGLVKLAADQEKAERELTAALEKTGEATRTNIERLKEFASAIQTATVFGDEAILSLSALGLNMGITTDKIQAAVKASIGLAAAFKIQLQGAMILVAKAAAGDTATLSKYGIKLDATQSKQAQFNQLLKIGADNFQLATAGAGTLSFELVQLKNAIFDVGEDLGFSFLPSLTKLIIEMKGVVPVVAKWVKENQALIFGAAKAAGGLAALAFLVSTVTVALIAFGLAAQGALLVLAGIAAVPLGALAAIAAALAAIALSLANITAFEDAIDDIISKLGDNSFRLNVLTERRRELTKEIAATEKETGENQDDLLANLSSTVRLLELQKEQLEVGLARLKETKNEWVENGGAIAEVDSRIGRARDRVNEVNAALEKEKGLLELITVELAAGAIAAERRKKIAEVQESIQKRIAKVRQAALREEGTFESKRLLLLEKEREKLEEINKLQRDAVKDLGTPLTAVFNELRQKTSELFQARLTRIVPDIEARPSFRPEFVAVEDLFRRLSTAGVQRGETEKQVNRRLLEQTLKLERETRDAVRQTARILEERLPGPGEASLQLAVVSGPP